MNEINSKISIVIPSYEPDDRLLDLCQRLKNADISDNVIILDDGSGKDYEHYFTEVSEKFGFTILRHAINLGKGRALKDAFNYVISNIPNQLGVVTADSDGQHSPEDIKRVMTTLYNNPKNLILGSRDFNGDQVPVKSSLGNKITSKVCKLAWGVTISDTQTGLRGIPLDFMKELLEVPGERFEFETRMLLSSKGKWPILEIPIETIYDSKEDHSSHFDPVKDSFRIYKIFFESFVKFLVSSMSSCLIDLILFYLLSTYLLKDLGLLKVGLSTVIARIISATYNYTINYNIVFNSNESHVKAGFKYLCLALVQMLSSAGLLTLGVMIFSKSSEIFVKIIVDSLLFIISYYIQREVVYKKK